MTTKGTIKIGGVTVGVAFDVQFAIMPLEDITTLDPVDYDPANYPANYEVTITRTIKLTPEVQKCMDTMFQIDPMDLLREPGE